MESPETWKPFPIAPDRYEVSNSGRVRSLDRTIIPQIGKPYQVKGKLLKPQLMTSGYHFVSIHAGGTPKPYSIHRMVALAFLPNPEELPFVNHKNAIKTDNRLENLEWCSAKENAQHAMSLGLINQKGKPRPDLKGSGNGRSILAESDVIAIRASRRKVKVKVLAKQYGVSPCTIENIQRGRIWKHLL